MLRSRNVTNLALGSISSWLLPIVRLSPKADIRQIGMNEPGADTRRALERSDYILLVVAVVVVISMVAMITVVSVVAMIRIMPAHVAITVMLPVMVLAAGRVSAVPRFILIPPIVPMVATIPVAVLIAKGYVAEIERDSNVVAEITLI